ncbi:MAG: histone deacetylase [Endomicrobia bacterium]|nr:histone deacetylase [Endomicrobiia bacterium]
MCSGMVVTSKNCCEYYLPGHPESPFRVKETYEYLMDIKKNLKVEIIEVNDPIEENILLLTHKRELVEKVKYGNFYDLDTPNLPNIFFYAKISANIVLESLKIALNGKKTFALTRPPGHHATRDQLGGFCYFNNIACAVNWYLKNLDDIENRKVAILDIDVHHGNGTEEIFWKNRNIIFLSIHQFGIYPGSGLVSRDNCINFPLFVNTSNEEYLKTLDKAFDIINNFNPKILGVSCGFDTFNEDPLAGLNLTEDCYYEIGKKISQLKLPTFCVLEGGYSKKLPRLIEEFLKGFFE